MANFAHIAAPLTCLTHNDVTFVWFAEEQEAFEHLRRCVHTPPVLGHFGEEAGTGAQ